jgi:hypothetical protein
MSKRIILAHLAAVGLIAQLTIPGFAIASETPLLPSKKEESAEKKENLSGLEVDSQSTQSQKEDPQTSPQKEAQGAKPAAKDPAVKPAEQEENKGFTYTVISKALDLRKGERSYTITVTSESKLPITVEASTFELISKNGGREMEKVDTKDFVAVPKVVLLPNKGSSRQIRVFYRGAQKIDSERLFPITLQETQDSQNLRYNDKVNEQSKKASKSSTSIGLFLNMVYQGLAVVRPVKGEPVKKNSRNKNPLPLEVSEMKDGVLKVSLTNPSTSAYLFEGVSFGEQGLSGSKFECDVTQKSTAGYHYILPPKTTRSCEAKIPKEWKEKEKVQFNIRRLGVER